MSNHPLARVRWSMGQVLRPEHFRALEDSVLTHTRARTSQLSLPDVGVVALQWQAAPLRVDGRLTLTELTIQMPSGALLTLNDNAELIGDPLLLGDAGGAVVPIYLHLMETSTPLVPASSPGAVAVERSLSHLRLAWDDVLPGSVEHLKLAVFRRDFDGGWALAESYIPPLLQTWRTPFLREPLLALGDTLTQLRSRLTQQLSIQYLEGVDPNYAQVGVRGIYSFQALLADLEAGLDAHPYLVFRQLRELFAVLYFYQGTTQRLSPELAASPYKHFALAECFSALLEAVGEVAGQDWVRPRYANFSRQQNRFTMDLPEDIAGASEIYLLIRKPRVGARVDPARLKLSTRARLDRIYQLALSGVGLSPAPLPAFAERLGPEVDFYRIERDSEWAFALSEGNLAFYLREGMAEISAAICWRPPTAPLAETPPTTAEVGWR